MVVLYNTQNTSVFQLDFFFSLTLQGKFICDEGKLVFKFVLIVF